MTFRPWPKIRHFKDAVEAMRRDGIAREVRFTAYPKLDGTNAAVRIHLDGTISYQSRNRTLSIGSDNHGFAAWASQHESYWRTYAPGTDIYGEWVGPGVQSTTALQQLGGKRFAVFCFIQRASDGLRVRREGTAARVPELLAPLKGMKPYAMERVVPHHTLVINPSDEASIRAAFEKIEAEVAVADKTCPWMASRGVEGIGEGFVYYPYSLLHNPLEEDDPRWRYLFKAKGPSHAKRVKVPKLPAMPLDDALVSKLTKMVEARLTQAVREVSAGERPTRKMTGDIVKWMVNDIEQEEGPTLCKEHPDTPFKRMQGAISKATAAGFLSLC